MRDNVLGTAAYGCDRLSEIAVERKREIEEIEGELNNLSQTWVALEQQPTQNLKSQASKVE